MLLFYTYLYGCYNALEAVSKEGYKSENFQTICKTRKEAVEELEKHIKKNKKLNKTGKYYVYIANAYEYAKYWEDTHFVFDYYVGDIKVIEGKVVPEKPFDENDFYMIEYSENFNSDNIFEYEPLPDDIKKQLEESMAKIEEDDAETINIDKAYDWKEKEDEISANIDSALSGGEFKPIAIKISDEAVKRYEEHQNHFNEAGFRALEKYLSEKSEKKD